MKINVTPIKCSHLKAGDLFSTVDQWYWNKYLNDKECIGQRVYIRTENECKSSTYNPEDIVYLIKIEA